jgi:hypothetical protein
LIRFFLKRANDCFGVAAAIGINYLDRSTIAIANPQIRAEFHMSAAAHGNHGFGYMQVIAGEGAVESEQ